MAPPTLDDLRRYAVGRSLFPPTTLPKAIAKLGFVQADPIRAPARAQDLTLRHRVTSYRAGDLERRYRTLGLEEAFFINYGFLPAANHGLLHPRAHWARWPAKRRAAAEAVLEFVRERGEVHPREVDERFQYGRSTNWWGGTSRAATQLLEAMHYRGFLRVVRRDAGIRVYAPGESSAGETEVAGAERIDRLADILIAKYAPIIGPSLSSLVRLLRFAVPQHRGELAAAVARVRARLQAVRIDGVDWYWPAGENPRGARWDRDDDVRLLTPFDPIVWDRRRFTAFWGWEYRFEAYLPAPKRKLGYYALPLLWRNRVIGWANATGTGPALTVVPGYLSGSAPRERAFSRELEAEIERLRRFLG
jgi:uncharacterized protein YcaQ